MFTITNNALIFAMFIVGSENHRNTEDTKISYKPNSQKISKQIKNKQPNIQMRSQHRISQPQWRGYSH